jgi:hypothetical protein
MQKTNHGAFLAVRLHRSGGASTIRFTESKCGKYGLSHGTIFPWGENRIVQYVVEAELSWGFNTQLVISFQWVCIAYLLQNLFDGTDNTLQRGLCQSGQPISKQMISFVVEIMNSQFHMSDSLIPARLPKSMRYSLL